MSIATPHVTTQGHQRKLVGEQEQKILVFSPDADLARSLSMLLEDRFQIVCETKLDLLKLRVSLSSPTLLLIDLFAFPGDVRRQLEVMRKIRTTAPIIILHDYRYFGTDIEKSIYNVADAVFYKPLNPEILAKAIYELVDRAR
jgi:DNA-binding response OmpR family regulator